MWKKQEEEEQVSPPERSSRPERRATPSGPQTQAERAAIGRSITIRGEVIGEEDLLIEGRVEGSVNLKEYAVTVGSEGEVTADVHGRVVVVEGHVEGDLHGDEQVILRETANVLGDIIAPRVTLEDGAYFRGSVEMTKDRDQERSTGSTKSGSASTSSPNAKEKVGQKDSGSTGGGSGEQNTKSAKAS